MDKNIIKIIGLLVGLVLLITIIVLIAINGLTIGPLNAVSISGIADKKDSVEKAKDDLAKAESQYEINMQSLETSKKEFKTQKDAYELISDETIAAIKEATKEEEYFIEYLWITLGNYATAHNLSLAIIEPGGTVAQGTTNTNTNADTDVTNVSTGTGITGNASGVTSTENTTTTSSTQTENEDVTNTSTNNTVTNITSSQNDLTVQVKGSYIDLADFVFEVENDQSLRFRLDNIKMNSAGGNEVITSFNVKDFTVLKSLE